MFVSRGDFRVWDGATIIKTTDQRLPRGEVFADSLGLAMAAAFIVWYCATIIGTYKLHASQVSDSVGYYTVSRTLLKTGHIDGHIIYPSTLYQNAPKNYLYMPGFYWCLAATFKVLGAGVKQGLVLNGVCLGAAAIATYALGRRYFSRGVALLAAGLLLMSPANHYFGATLMMEICLLAATTIAIAVFAYVPRRWMIPAGPMLLIAPFLIRETNAFLVLPMLAMLVDRCRREGVNRSATLVRAAGLATASVLVLGLVYISPVSAGRPSLWTLGVFHPWSSGSTVYRDAMAGRNLHPTLSEWRHALASRFAVNLHLMIDGMTSKPFRYTTAVLYPTLINIPLGFWAWARRGDPLALGGALLVLVIVLLTLLLHMGLPYHMTHMTMFIAPFTALLLASTWDGIAQRWLVRLPGAMRAWPGALLAMVLAFVALRQTYISLHEMMWRDGPDAADTELLGRLRIDNRSTIVAPYPLAMDYLAIHWTLKYSFPPANRGTLDLLCTKYPVSLYIYDPKDAMDILPQDVLDQGLRPFCHLQAEGSDYVVYRRPLHPGEELSWHPERIERSASDTVRSP